MDSAAATEVLPDSTRVQMQDGMPVGDPTDKQYHVKAPAATAAAQESIMLHNSCFVISGDKAPLTQHL